MATDWIATLQEQTEFVTQIADDVERTLALPNLTVVQASRLYRVVEQGAQCFDRLIDEFDQQNLDAGLVEATEIIEDMWIKLSIAATNKLRAMQGLASIEIEDAGE
jgi:hypothetical protein